MLEEYKNPIIGTVLSIAIGAIGGLSFYSNELNNQVDKLNNEKAALISASNKQERDYNDLTLRVEDLIKEKEDYITQIKGIEEAVNKSDKADKKTIEEIIRQNFNNFNEEESKLYIPAKMDRETKDERDRLNEAKNESYFSEIGRYDNQEWQERAEAIIQIREKSRELYEKMAEAKTDQKFEEMSKQLKDLLNYDSELKKAQRTFMIQELLEKYGIDADTQIQFVSDLRVINDSQYGLNLYNLEEY
jgi:hypothetical protein